MVTLCTALVFSGLPLDASADAKEPLLRRTPKDSPNVVLVLLDDVGFGTTSTFGGPVATPGLDALAAEGIRFTRFHTTGICSPTRASLLTGRNPHATGIGAVINSSDARPGYTGFHRKDTATIAEILRQNGYSTAAFGKWHQTPDWEMSQSGPFDRWPTGEGFEYFYGFMGGETDQFEPTLFEGTVPVMRPAGDGYHLTDDLATRAIDWLRSQRSVTPDKPFLLYFSTGGIHAPIQAPASFIDAYRGRFDQGWDQLRQSIYQRQLERGVIPAGTRLTPRPTELPAWDSLSADQQRVAARLMEAYAGFMAHTDAQVARLVGALKASDIFDNTLFIYIVGDNGGSAEGGLSGSLNYMGQIQGLPEFLPAQVARLDEIGSADAYAHINSAWAWAVNAPFQWTKTVASHLGGTRNPMIMSWPAGFVADGSNRQQFAHVNDIVPTILEAAGIPAPRSVNGIEQLPIDGQSLLYAATDADADERHRTQYFEVFGNRAIYHDGWMASAFHGRLPWDVIPRRQRSFDEDQWELYDLRSDFSQADDLAARFPDRVDQMKTLFMKEAERNNVLPLAGQQLGQRGLPDLSRDVRTATYYPGARVPESAFPAMFNRSWQLQATVEVASGARGVIAALGGGAAGWSLYIDGEGQLVFQYRVFDLSTATLLGAALENGRHQLHVLFEHDGKPYGGGGDLSLVVDGDVVATGTLPATPPALFTIDELFAVGIDTGSPAGAYPPDALPGYALRDASVDHVTIQLEGKK